MHFTPFNFSMDKVLDFLLLRNKRRCALRPAAAHACTPLLPPTAAAAIKATLFMRKRGREGVGRVQPRLREWQMHTVLWKENNQDAALLSLACAGRMRMAAGLAAGIIERLCYCCKRCSCCVSCCISCCCCCSCCSCCCILNCCCSSSGSR